MAKTARQVWEGMLIELSKVNAPSLLLDDFNYFINKAIYQYINKRYNLYDISDQTTDDLRVLKATAVLPVQKMTDAAGKDLKLNDVELSNLKAGSASIFGATYEAVAPLDYYHILNCICIYKMQNRYGCHNKDDYTQYAAKRLTADAWSAIVNDYYNRPLPWRPYYYIHNINKQQNLPTNVISNNNKLDLKVTGTDPESESKGMPTTLDISQFTGSFYNKEAGLRYGNSSNVRIEIRYGNDDSTFKLEGILMDYLKTPQEIRLTQEQVNLTQDTSQVMEFPDYVCQEIINELTHLVMENTADPRLQTHPVITTTIANPAQAQPTTTKK